MFFTTIRNLSFEIHNSKLYHLFSVCMCKIMCIFLFGYSHTASCDLSKTGLFFVLLLFDNFVKLFHIKYLMKYSVPILVCPLCLSYPVQRYEIKTKHFISTFLIIYKILFTELLCFFIFFKGFPVNLKCNYENQKK